MRVSISLHAFEGVVFQLPLPCDPPHRTPLLNEIKMCGPDVRMRVLTKAWMKGECWILTGGRGSDLAQDCCWVYTWMGWQRHTSTYFIIQLGRTYNCSLFHRLGSWHHVQINFDFFFLLSNTQLYWRAVCVTRLKWHIQLQTGLCTANQTRRCTGELN